MEPLKPIDRKVLFELMKDSHRSDREVGRAAEVYSFLPNSAIVEGACSTHSVFAFASFAPAFGLSMVSGTESAGKTTDSDFDVTLFHLRGHLVGDYVWCLGLCQFYFFWSALRGRDYLFR